MRNYAIVPVNIWDSEMSLQLRKLGLPYHFTAHYMLTATHSNMIGIYRLSPHDIAGHIGISAEKAEEVIRKLVEIDFCRYDWERNFVWVIEHADIQIGTLKPRDKRATGVKKILNNLPKVNFLEAFISRYDEQLCISQKPLRSKELELDLEQEHDLELELDLELLSSKDRLSCELNDSVSPEEKSNTTRKIKPSKATQIFAFWQAHLHHPKAKLDAKRERVIRTALKHYSVAELKQAIRGCGLSAFHRGENDCGKRHAHRDQRCNHGCE